MNSFGKEPICNHDPTTAPHIGSFCFPICWRCLSLSVGIILAEIILRVDQSCNYNVIHRYRFLLILLVIPCALDGLLHYTTDYKSHNIIRIISGLIAGIAIRLLVFLVVQL